jgi:hypothetical protein
MYDDIVDELHDRLTEVQADILQSEDSKARTELLHSIADAFVPEDDGILLFMAMGDITFDEIMLLKGFAELREAVTTRLRVDAEIWLNNTTSL